MSVSSTNSSYDIYLSFPEENDIVIDLKKKLIDLNYNICDSSIVTNNLDLETMCYSEISEHILNLFKNTSCIIVCLSLNSFKTHLQIIEMNKLLDNSFEYNNNKIIYLVTDLNYLGLLTDSITNKKNYFPCYNQETFNDSFEKMVEILQLLSIT